MLLEEVAFRGVLLGLLSAVAAPGLGRRRGLRAVRPVARGPDRRPPRRQLHRQRDRVLILAGSVAPWRSPDVLLCGLRLATGSLAAPAAVHVSVTATATAAAYVVQRSTRSRPVCA